jgi:branched-chain amino acid transport system permease protein
LCGLTAVVFLVFLPLGLSDYYVSVLLDLLMWSALTASWIILSGYTGYISLAHSAFFGLGAYFMAMTWTHLPYTVGVILGGVICSAFALAIGFPFLRVRGPYFVILTLGLTEITKYVFINLEIKLGGTVGRILMMTPGLNTLYYSILVVCVATMFAAFFVKRSRFGTGLLSIKEDEDAANSLGVNTSLYKWIAFGVSAFFPGMVGAIMALRRSYIDPYTVFNPMVSFQVIVMAFLGGVEGIEGAIVGTVVLSLLSEVLWAQYPYFYMIILGLIIIIIVKFMPMGVVFAIKDRFHGARSRQE